MARLGGAGPSPVSRALVGAEKEAALASNALYRYWHMVG